MGGTSVSTSIRGRRRSVLIILELTFNAGWADIAEKVAKFSKTK